MTMARPTVPELPSFVEPTPTAAGFGGAPQVFQSDFAPHISEHAGNVPLSPTIEELTDLEQRQAQLAERKRRLMELERIEAEEAEIARRMADLKQS